MFTVYGPMYSLILNFNQKTSDKSESLYSVDFICH